MKKKVLVVLPSDRIVQVLYSSGALDQIYIKYDVTTLSPGEVGELDGIKHCKLDTKLSGSKILNWIDTQLWYHYLYEYMQKHNISEKESFKASQLSMRSQLMHKMLSRKWISKTIGKFSENILLGEDKGIKKYLQELEPDLVLAPGAAIDTYSHMILKSAKNLGIKTAIIVAHWDYFSKKGMLRINPDKVFVWGEEMRQAAIERNELIPDTVSILGSPQMDKYAGYGRETGKNNSREKLGFPEDKILLLFAGTSAPFDELYLLERLDGYLTEFDKNKKILIVYRPHPGAWDRATKKSVKIKDLKNVILDPQRKSVEVDSARWGSLQHYSDNSHYLDLMNAIDGLVTPFSTMIVESALCGKPSLCIAYPDGVNKWDFSEALNTEHIKPLLAKDWLTCCTDESKIKEVFKQYLEQVSLKQDSELIRESIKETIHYDKRTYSQRLETEVSKMILH